MTRRKGHPERVVISDEELVRLISLGDRAGVELLIRRYDQLLFRTARGILKDDAEAEDAVQEGFLLAHRGIAQFRQQAKLSTWLVRIVANVAMARLRKNSRRPRTIPLDDDALQETHDRNSGAGERPDEALARADTRRLKKAGTSDALRASNGSAKAEDGPQPSYVAYGYEGSRLGVC